MKMIRTRALLSALLVLTVCLPLVALQPATAEPGVFQTAKNRQIKSFTMHFKRICPECQDGGVILFFTKAQAKVHVTVGTYRIADENAKYDFYFVDVDTSISQRSGDMGYGWLDTDLVSIGRTKIVSASYSLGRSAQNVDSCTSFPVDLGVGFFGVSAGTSVGAVSFCHDGSKLTSADLSHSLHGGRTYHATGIAGIRGLDMRRFVRVPQGAHPRFGIVATTNHDSKYWDAANRRWRVRHQEVVNGLDIGTRPQR
jgi:hypothetical protein